MTPAKASRFADAVAAQRAVAMALPSLEALVMDPRVCGSGFLYIVIMDPGLNPDRCSFSEAVLHEHSVGDRRLWDADYAAYARAKAALSWRLKCDTHKVQNELPHLLVDGDTLLAGGVWVDGLTVGVSGAEAAYDVAFATTIAANLRAVAACHRLECMRVR